MTTATIVGMAGGVVIVTATLMSAGEVVAGGGAIGMTGDGATGMTDTTIGTIGDIATSGSLGTIGIGITTATKRRFTTKTRSTEKTLKVFSVFLWLRGELTRSKWSFYLR
jgi:hypothetical protein